MPLDPSGVFAPSAYHPVLAGPTLNCFRRACFVHFVRFVLSARFASLLPAVRVPGLRLINKAYLIFQLVSANGNH